MDPFFEQFAVRAATIDELLSDNFEVLLGQKAQAEGAARRLSSWCLSSASGDWKLFSRRLARDGLALDETLSRLASVRRKPNVPLPQWVCDAQWIDSALKNPANEVTIKRLHAVGEPQAFEHLLAPIIEYAEKFLWQDIPDNTAKDLRANASLSYWLSERLSRLCAPAFYNCFVSSRVREAANEEGHSSVGAMAPTSRYDRFVAEMRQGGLRHLFETKPVLLRLVASITRQWIEATKEFLTRLHVDLPSIRQQFLHTSADIVHVVDGLGDFHNFGRSVRLVRFSDGAKILYKPKDLNVDALWFSLVEELNACDTPIDLKAARVLPKEGYGWSEFIDHADCSDRDGFHRFFRRAGAWLCLFHLFGVTDMHEENMIAAGEHPVAVDLEMILQAAITGDQALVAPERHAFELASRTIADSVMNTGLLPAYARTPENAVYSHSGLNNPQNDLRHRFWENVNTDSMRAIEIRKSDTGLSNMPRFNGQEALFGDFIDDVVAGYQEYAEFLLRYRTSHAKSLFDDFVGLTVRRILRPTRFYSLLLERLKDHRNMADGAIWSAHLDFMARLMDWDQPTDPLWPILRAERLSLADLNIPHFISPVDRDQITDKSSVAVSNGSQPGLHRAQGRFVKFDKDEIAWQSDVIRLSTKTVTRSGRARDTTNECTSFVELPTIETSWTEAILERALLISRELAKLAIRSGPSAAWIGLDWLGDSEVCQLSPLGADLYNGAPGISIFLAAHAKVTGNEDSRQLALAGVSCLRHDLGSRSGARFARMLGTGGSIGLGSVIYALTVLSELLNEKELLADALSASSLFTSDLITADQRFDVMEGSAGGMLGLLKLYRATGDYDVLARAARCGDHLLNQRYSGAERKNTWVEWSSKQQLLNGMSHGAAGFAYALAALALATGRSEFGQTAQECINAENQTFSTARSNWPDLRTPDGGAEPFWPCQWCHGACGIGMARMGILKQATADPHMTTVGLGSIGRDGLLADIRRAAVCAKRAWPYPIDSLCCGSLGNIELLNETARFCIDDEIEDLRDEALRRTVAIIKAADLRGDYLWVVGNKRFNLGLFRGLAGVGYTLLRLLDRELPNLLIWE